MTRWPFVLEIHIGICVLEITRRIILEVVMFDRVACLIEFHCMLNLFYSLIYSESFPLYNKLLLPTSKKIKVLLLYKITFVSHTQKNGILRIVC